MTHFSVTQGGKPLDKSLYTWDEETRTFSTKENNLVLDFSGLNGCIFKTGSSCAFKTGEKCTFKTGSDCTFDTGRNCTFNTGNNCTFDTGNNCTFNTGWYCAFVTGYSCSFKTGWNCAFNTGWNCTFDTGNNCAFNTGSHCTFNTGLYCVFNTGSHCVFKTGSDCTFKTGSDCTFDTGRNCTFNTGNNCTFDTGNNCTFNTGTDCTFDTGDNCTFKTGEKCVVIRRDIFEVIKLAKDATTQLAPYKTSGYVKNGYYYKGGKKQYKAIIADGILSEIINQKGNVYKVKNHGQNEITYLVKDGDIYSHGKTLQEVKESLIYKISNRDTSKYKDYDLNTKVSKKDAIQMYRCITGACEQGTRMFVESLENVPESLTVEEIINITKGQYGNDKFREFFGKGEYTYGKYRKRK